MALGSTLRIAWRNLGRNRRRTALALAAVGFAELVLILYDGMLTGYVATMVQSATGPVVGHAQVHAPKWREDRALDRVITDVTARLEALRRQPGVTKVSARTYGPSLVAKGEDGQASVVVGVDLGAEQHLGLLDGVPLRRLPQRGELLVGEYLAQKLEAKPGDELALVGQAADGSIASGLFVVADVVSTQVDLVNRLGLVMSLDDSRELLALGDVAHELVVVGADPQGAEALAARLATLESLRGLEVRSWRQLLPELASILDVVWAYEYFLLVLVFVAAAAGAANTMMMATFERTRELGMLLALGMKPRRVVGLVVVEGVMLGVLGLALGAAAGLALVAVTHRTGIDISRLAGDTPSISFVGMKWTMVMHPVVNLMGLWRSLVAVLLVSLLAALWPAARAARLAPVEAMRS